MTFSTETLMRTRHAHQHEPVTFVELFFDLVFVFAVTQLSHGLIAHPTPRGLLHTALLLCAVWWVWIYTTWVTNWLDPRAWPVRLMLFVVMLAGLYMSASIPDAFGRQGLVFGVAFAGIQLGRSLFTLFAVRGDNGHRLNFQRITVWLAVSAVCWVAGGLAPPGVRLGLWALAVVIEFVGPSAGFFVPGLGRSVSSDWNVEGGHIAERCGLFIIIALGESVLVTGATYAETTWTAPHTLAFLAAFATSVTMWWIYFNAGAEEASERIADAVNPGRLARVSYTYFHLPLVAGIIVAAVGDELALAHPLGHVEIKTALAITAGPALFLLGATLFKLSVFGVVPIPRLAGICAQAALLAVASRMTPVGLTLATTGVLMGVAIWEHLLHRRDAAASRSD
jgi:low temperature requirement protein LtrA